MSDIVIAVENLSKSYLVGHRSAQREQYTALRDVISREMRNLARKTVAVLRGRQIVQGDEVEEFWALQDVSFEVKQGEVLGIIGRNGAGKSTLLKILSRITKPDRGRVILRGRVGSLLEVGTGFHPELSGRENIYLNGAILGMKRAEIKQKFDEIVAFAEIDRFVDTPVKRYSSGMYVRLAFAVAAHLDPEILVIDEVLAVGDAEFQNKCLRKISEVSGHGRTVLFVSHDLRKVTALCNRGILLADGRIECEGSISTVADAYLKNRVNIGSIADLSLRSDRTGSGEVQFQSIELLKDRRPCTTLSFGEEYTLKIGVRVKNAVGKILLQALIATPDGLFIQEFFSANDGVEWAPSVGRYTVKIAIEKLRLYPGSYSIDLWLADDMMRRLDSITQALTFNVIQTADCEVSRLLDRKDGLVYQPAQWTMGKADQDTLPSGNLMTNDSAFIT
jgi:lipopolysaccharide transport system ATP-binding protein